MKLACEQQDSTFAATDTERGSKDGDSKEAETETERKQRSLLYKSLNIFAIKLNSTLKVV